MISEAHIEDYKILKLTVQEIGKVNPIFHHAIASGVFATEDFLEILHEKSLITNCRHKEWMLQMMATSLDNYTKKEMINRYVYIQNLCPDTKIK
jgi:hypothetical protein